LVSIITLISLQLIPLLQDRLPESITILGATINLSLPELAVIAAVIAGIIAVGTKLYN
jgi:hypothetical protein